MYWGTVYFSYADDHPYVVVSAHGSNVSMGVTLLARLTSHSHFVARRYGRCNDPVSQRLRSIVADMRYLPLGEASLSYGSARWADVYPQGTTLRLSICQGYNLKSVSSGDLQNQRLWQLEGSLSDTQCAVLSNNLREAFLGLTTPPLSQASRAPASWSSPGLSDLVQGALYEITHHATAKRSLCVVVSHDHVHRYFPDASVLLMPVADISAGALEDRYDFLNVISHHEAYAPARPARVSVSTASFGTLLPLEVRRVTANLLSLLSPGSQR